jgi:hypothetical protein
MRSCDICPGGDACAGINLTPILLRVFELYVAGKTDKFEILFALDEDEEELLEMYTSNVSRACWSKAALSAIVEVLVRSQEMVTQGGEWTAVVEGTLHSAAAAYAQFPWHLPDLVEQAPELHAVVLERISGGDFGTAISKRGFAKLCKASVYGHLK